MILNMLNVLTLARTSWGRNGITYSFITPTSVPSYYQSTDTLRTFFGSNQSANTVQVVDAYLEAELREALAAWAAFGDLQFNQVVSGGDIDVGKIPFQNRPDPLNKPSPQNPGVSGSGVAAGTISNSQSTTPPTSPVPQTPTNRGDIWLSTRPMLNQPQMASGSTGAFSIVHEVGHALGLKGDDLSALMGGTDSQRYTVMSYAPVASAGSQGGYPRGPYRPMLLDIAAIQWLYGANPLTNAEPGTEHRFETVGGWRIKAIWDAGGMGDVLDATGKTERVWINLAPGGESYTYTDPRASWDLNRRLEEIHIAFTPLDRSTTNGTIDQAWAGNFIENANGGNANDDIFGNDAANVLRGNGGDDWLSGGAGSDT